MLKRKDSMVARTEGDKLEIMPLGAGNEVGRSCCHMTYKGKTVLFDCGIHPGYTGMAALPYFDEIDPSTIDVLLVTHFHLDHAASLPYFLEKTTFKGRVFMTHATKAIYKLLLSDFVKISKVSVEDMLYDEQDVARTMDKIEVIDFHQTMEVKGIRFWCYTAGHVLGAAMFMVDIAGVRVLYTGDYSREEDRHLKAAEMPQFAPDICIIESTYGVQVHQPRQDREKRFTDTVAQSVAQGGRVLIPAFALGRAQELLLILDEYWETHPELQHIPIYYASPLAKKCMAVYQTYINSMNDRIRSQYEVSNPFNFKHILSLKSIEQFEDVGPSVVMASPSGLQSGLSRQLFDRWCQDRKNSCIIPGYVVEGTLAKTLLNEPKEVTLVSGLVVPLHMKVVYISFSAHADFRQTSAFLGELKPPNIILVHGEHNEMGRLKVKLQSQFQEDNVKVLSPKNCQTVEMFFKGDKVAKAVGSLAAKTPGEGDPVSGLLIKKSFTYQLMAADDLHVYTQLSRGSIMQKLLVPYTGAFVVLRHRIEHMYEGVEELITKNNKNRIRRKIKNKSSLLSAAGEEEDEVEDEEEKDAEDDAEGDAEEEEVEEEKEEGSPSSLRIHDKVTLLQHLNQQHVVLQWVSDPVSDMIADSVIAMITKLDPCLQQQQQQQQLTDIKSSSSKVDELKLVQSLLLSLFGDVKVDEQGQGLEISVDGQVASLDYSTKAIQCEDENLKERIQLALRRMHHVLHPLSAAS